MKVKRQVFWSAVAAFTVTAAVFFPVVFSEFLNWDDNALFLENMAFRGFAPANLQWMCSTFHCGHWQPLSWLSYALDFQLWELNPVGWHLTGWLLHALNAALLFLLCMEFLKNHPERGKPAAVLLATLFYALHPLRVETAAWLSARGYLLGTAFSLLTILFYLRAVERRRYPVVALFCFVLAALSKGIVMTLSPVLLLIDWVPLGRITSFRRAAACVVEKIPFFLVSLLTGLLAFLAKRSSGGMFVFGQHGLAERLGQAVYGIWFYVWKTLIPVKLSPIYSRPPDALELGIAFALTALAAVLVVCFWRKIYPLLAAAGAALLLIFPMLGITRSGSQLFADRFTCLATIPFIILLAGGLARVVRFRRLIFASCSLLLVVLSVQSAVWCRSWQSSLSLWESAASVEPGSCQVWNNAGLALHELGRYQQAEEYFDRAVFLYPEFVQAWNNRALVQAIQGDWQKALDGWNTALSMRGSYYQDRVHMRKLRGWAYEQTGNPVAALEDYTSIIDDVRATDEQRAGAFLLRARVYAGQQQYTKARADLQQVLALPDPFGKRHEPAHQILEEIARRKIRSED